MLGSEYIVDFLCSKKCSFYTFPGGTIAPLYDELLKKEIKPIVTRHEQGAGYAALAHSRLEQKPQVVMVTSGPGVTNVMSTIADAYYDSTPLIVLTGQVGTADLNSGRKVRQLGFQQVDTPALVASICKKVYQVHDASLLPSIMQEAYNLTTEGRRGPVVIDLPMDVQRSEFDPGATDILSAQDVSIPTKELDIAMEYLKSSNRPAILAGQGVIQAGAVEILRAIALKHQIPVVSTLLGLGVMSGDLHVGFVGHTGTQIAGQVLQESDCILVIGSRLDVRQTGSCTEDFARNAKIIRIDQDIDELNYSRVRQDVAIHADCANILDFFKVHLKSPDSETLKNRSTWINDISNRKTQVHSSPTYKTAQEIVEAIDFITKEEEVIVTTGVGSHQHWTARHFSFDFPKRILLTSGGHGTMGYDLPSAIGAAFAYPERLSLCFVGDASLQMNIQELQTITDNNLNVKIIVMDNNRMALVSQFQNLTWNSDPTTNFINNPSFIDIAKAYNIPAYRVKAAEDLKQFHNIIKQRGPLVLHCQIDPKADIIPMLLGGEKLDAMYNGQDNA